MPVFSRQLGVVAGVAAALVVPTAASAATQSASAVFPITTGQHALPNIHFVDRDDPSGIAHFDRIDVASNVTWSGTLGTNISWDSANLKAGSTLKVSRN